MPQPKVAPGVIVRPSKPAPHPFWDRTNKIEAAAMGTAMAFYQGQTCHFLAPSVAHPIVISAKKYTQARRGLESETKISFLLYFSSYRGT